MISLSKSKYLYLSLHQQNPLCFTSFCKANKHITLFITLYLKIYFIKTSVCLTVAQICETATFASTCIGIDVDLYSYHYDSEKQIKLLGSL